MEEFPTLFYGYILWREPADKSEEMPGEALGVWSKRTSSRFRRILRERGAVFKVIEGEGVFQQLLITS